MSSFERVKGSRARRIEIVSIDGLSDTICLLQFSFDGHNVLANEIADNHCWFLCVINVSEAVEVAFVEENVMVGKGFAHRGTILTSFSSSTIRKCE
jgi:hypothetical protein